MLVIHFGSPSAFSVCLLCGLVIFEPSGDGLFVLGVEEGTDLFDVTNHCASVKNQHRKLTEADCAEQHSRAAARDREKSNRQTIRNSLSPSA